MNESDPSINRSTKHARNGIAVERSERGLPAIGFHQENQRFVSFARESVGAAPARDVAAKSSVLLQQPPLRNPPRALAVSMPGLLLLGRQNDLMASNAEAIRILCYPEKPDKRRQLSLLVANKIPMELLRAAASGNTIAEFLSGRRRYICSAHRLDVPGREKETTALLLERISSPEVTLYGICQKYNLTTREREAMGHLLRGLTSKEIAQQMRISPNTVKAFVHSAMTKMGVSTRAGLIGRIAGTTPADTHGYRDLPRIRGA
jgi:DNA-binding NarL/FixJ family response regulator